ncbi:hypothetical protein CDAR_232481 [Caerostris darwini]|uniref:Uncharacterized protein n=1 Tax=Caerostris darwini TaxID=1538125 RepID=A0AAV4W5C5_9ARAC|nr:hypothetical protein CDAR_232481 [Caerostris darwini]
MTPILFKTTPPELLPNHLKQWQHLNIQRKASVAIWNGSRGETLARGGMENGQKEKFVCALIQNDATILRRWGMGLSEISAAKRLWSEEGEGEEVENVRKEKFTCALIRNGVNNFSLSVRVEANQPVRRGVHYLFQLFVIKAIWNGSRETLVRGGRELENVRNVKFTCTLIRNGATILRRWGMGLICILLENWSRVEEFSNSNNLKESYLEWQQRNLVRGEGGRVGKSSKREIRSTPEFEMAQPFCAAGEWA